jgi:hypothetical protein
MVSATFSCGYLRQEIPGGGGDRNRVFHVKHSRVQSGGDKARHR